MKTETVNFYLEEKSFPLVEFDRIQRYSFIEMRYFNNHNIQAIFLLKDKLKRGFYLMCQEKKDQVINLAVYNLETNWF